MKSSVLLLLNSVHARRSIWGLWNRSDAATRVLNLLQDPEDARTALMILRAKEVAQGYLDDSSSQRSKESGVKSMFFLADTSMLQCQSQWACRAIGFTAEFLQEVLHAFYPVYRCQCDCETLE